MFSIAIVIYQFGVDVEQCFFVCFRFTKFFKINAQEIAEIESMMELSAVGERVFRVESILKKRKKKSKIEYYVKWNGWSSSHNTWEPDENIIDRALIEDFNRRSRQKDNKKSSKNKPIKKETTDDVPSSTTKRKAKRIDESDSSDSPVCFDLRLDFLF